MKEVKAEVITIGDEILYGQITDTNTQFVSERLTELGIKTVRKSSVGDTEEAILGILNEAFQRANLVICTGGLGPTKDDITKKTIAKFFNVGFKTDKATLDHVTDFFQKRGRPMLEVNNMQAEVPANCEVLPNRQGTAPGMWFEHEGKVLISLPGVPFEMKHILLSAGLDKIKSFFKPPIILHKMIHTIGLGESFLADLIKDWESNLPNHIKLAYLPSLGVLKLRLTAIGDDSSILKNDLDRQVKLVEPLIGKYIFGYDEFGNFPAFLGELLKSKALTVATAESCTGGHVAHLITSISGSSEYFKGSVVAYSNDIKVEVLNVDSEVLNKNGAVSEAVAKAMAQNVRKKLKSDIGISTTGIAGPNGGTEEKPVGTVWVGYSDQNQTIAMKVLYASNRENNIKLFSLYALNLIRIKLLNMDK